MRRFLAKSRTASRIMLHVCLIGSCLISIGYPMANVVAVTPAAVAESPLALDENTPPLPAAMPLPSNPIAVGASVGYLPGSWDVSPTGQFAYSIPLDVPTGRAGMQPSLSLEYSSGAGNGLLGVGWSLLGLSSITRCAKTLASDGVVKGVDYQSDDNYCLDGNKLVAIQGTYGEDNTEYRTEHDIFAKVVSFGNGPDHFTVQTKNGMTHTYTSVTAIRCSPDGVSAQDPSTSVIESWLLASVMDTSGNLMEYTYKIFSDGNSECPGQQVVPDHIEYTSYRGGGDANSMPDEPPYRSIQFDYEDLEPLYIEVSWHSGVRTSLLKRLKSITMSAPYPSGWVAGSTSNTTAVWAYFLEYATSGFSSRSLLKSVKKCGMKGTVIGACTWKKKFGWKEDGNSPVFLASTLDTFNAVIDPQISSGYLLATRVSDVDGDGMDDVLVQPGAEGCIYSIDGPLGSLCPEDPNRWLRTSRNQPPPLGWVSLLGNKFFDVLPGVDLANTYPLDFDSDGTSELFTTSYEEVMDPDLGCGSVPFEGWLVPVVTMHNTVMRWNVFLPGFSPVTTFPTPPCGHTDSHWFADFDGDRRLDHLRSDLYKPPKPPEMPLTANDIFVPATYRFNLDTGLIEMVTGAHMVYNVDHSYDPYYLRYELAMNVGGGFGSFNNDLGVTLPLYKFHWKRYENGSASYNYTDEIQTLARSGAKVLDVDGDGRGEMGIWTETVVNKPPDPTSNVDNTYSIAIADITSSIHSWLDLLKQNMLVVDLNGDGLTDVLDPVKSQVYWNTGNGLQRPVQLGAPALGDPNSTFRVADMNGDGRGDIIELRPPPADKIYLHLSQVDGSFTSKSLPGKAGFFLDGDRNPFPTTWPGDFNGDSQLDMIRVVPGQNGQNSKLELVKNLNLSTGSDRIVWVIDEPTSWPAQVVTYDWKWTDKPEQDLIPGNSYPKHRIRRGLTVVRQVDVRDHLVDPSWTYPERSLYYSYEGPLSDLRGRGFLGFSKMRIWDPARPSEKTVHFSNYVQWPTSAYPYALRPTEVRTVTPLIPPVEGVRQSGIETLNARITQVVYTNQVKSLNGGKSYVDLPSSWTSWEWEEGVSIDWGALDDAPANPTSEHMFDIDESIAMVLRKRSGSYQFDDYGNLIDHVVTTESGATVQVVSGYDNLTNNWLIGLLRQQTTTVQEAGQLPSTRVINYDYDASGRLTAVFREKNNVDIRTRQTINYTLDSYGLVTKVLSTAEDPTAPPARAMHIEYEPWWPGQPDERVYPSQFWQEFTPLPYRPTQWVVYHPAYGVEVASMDANGVSAGATYDDLGRPLTIYPAGTASISFTYAGRVDTAGGINGTVVTTTQGGSLLQSTSDALGREIISSHKGFDGSMVNVASQFDVLGRVVSQSRPYPAGPPTKFTTYNYDPLDRLTQVLLPDTSKIENQHEFFKTTTWDGEHNESSVERDVNDRIVKSVNIWGNIPVTTKFDYEAFGLLSAVTDDKGNINSYEHDAIGRTTFAVDPDAGSTHFVYNGFDAVTSMLHVESQTPTYGSDALGGDEPDLNQTTTYSYDALGRPTGFVGPDGPTTFTWDTQLYGIGKLASATSPDGVKTVFNYDNFGRSSGFVETIGSAKYAVSMLYDLQGRLHQLLYPSTDGTATPGLTVTYDYNAANYLNEINYSAPGVLKHPLWRAVSRNLDGALTSGFIGNTLDVVRDYDPNLGRLTKTQFKHAGGGNTVFDLDYTYWANGLVKTRNDNVASRQETFTYDTIGRLWKWDLTYNAITRKTQYDYDALGNLTQVMLNLSPVEENSYGESGAPPHALTSQLVNGVTTSIGYDTHGRQTTLGSSREVTHYSDFNLPKSVISGGKTWSFLYDAFGGRAKKTGINSSSNWTYIGELYERRVDNGVTTHIFHAWGPEGPVADFSRTNAGSPLVPTYLLNDVLGSVGALANDTAGVIGKQYFEPFGKRINADGLAFTGSVGPVKDGFTGHEHEDLLGLINMRGRLYDPGLRRMLTPDPHVTFPLYSQSWNRYSYVHNNPLNFTDPTGFDDIGKEGNWQWCWFICSSGSSSSGTSRSSGDDWSKGSGGVQSNTGGGTGYDQPDPPVEERPEKKWSDVTVPQSSLDSYVEPVRASQPGSLAGAGTTTNATRPCTGAGDVGCSHDVGWIDAEYFANTPLGDWIVSSPRAPLVPLAVSAAVILDLAFLRGAATRAVAAEAQGIVSASARVPAPFTSFLLTLGASHPLVIAVNQRMAGIYTFMPGSGQSYIGWSVEVGRRIPEHIRSGRLPVQNLNSLHLLETFAAGTPRSVGFAAEAQWIQLYGGVGGLANWINSPGGKVLEQYFGIVTTITVP